LEIAGFLGWPVRLRSRRKESHDRPVLLEAENERLNGFGVRALSGFAFGVIKARKEFPPQQTALAVTIKRQRIQRHTSSTPLGSWQSSPEPRNTKSFGCQYESLSRESRFGEQMR
jgi:hypothetical protein